MGKFSEVFDLVIWRSRKKSPNQIPSILNPAALAGWLATQVPGIITIAVPPLQEEYLYTPQRMQCWGFLSLSRKETHIANKSTRQEQTAARARAYMLQCGLTSKPSEGE